MVVVMVIVMIVMVIVMVIAVLSDEDELGTSLHRSLVCYVAVTAVEIEPVEDTVQNETIVFWWIEGDDVFAEMI